MEDALFWSSLGLIYLMFGYVVALSVSFGDFEILKRVDSTTGWNIVMVVVALTWPLIVAYFVLSGAWSLVRGLWPLFRKRPF